MAMQTYKDWFSAHVNSNGGIFLDDRHGGGIKFMFQSKTSDNIYYIGHHYCTSELPDIEFNKHTLFKEPKLTFFCFLKKEVPLTQEVAIEMYFSQKQKKHPKKMLTKWQYKNNKMYITFVEDKNTWTQLLDEKALPKSRKLMHDTCKNYGTFTTVEDRV